MLDKVYDVLTMIFLPYYPRLMTASAALRTFLSGFPDNSCAEAAHITALLCPELEILAGYYTPSFSNISQVQSWNYDAKKELYVDLSLEMYQPVSHEKIPHIAISSAQNPRYHEDSGFTKFIIGCRNSIFREPEIIRLLDTLGFDVQKV